MGPSYKEDMKSSIIRSIIDLLVLNIIKDRPLCGNEIGVQVRKKFGVFVSPSMMYSLLGRLEAKDYICCHSANAMKKNFLSTDKGKRFRSLQARHLMNFNELLEGWLRA